MTLQEWIDRKTAELKVNRKYREVEFLKATPVRLARNTYSLELFSRTTIPLDSTVKEYVNADLPDSRKQENYLPGVMVWFNVVKPRCRKTDREHHNLLLV